MFTGQNEEEDGEEGEKESKSFEESSWLLVKLHCDVVGGVILSMATAGRSVIFRFLADKFFIIKFLIELLFYKVCESFLVATVIVETFSFKLFDKINFVNL